MWRIKFNLLALNVLLRLLLRTVSLSWSQHFLLHSIAVPFIWPLHTYIRQCNWFTRPRAFVYAIQTHEPFAVCKYYSRQTKWIHWAQFYSPPKHYNIFENLIHFYCMCFRCRLHIHFYRMISPIQYNKIERYYKRILFIPIEYRQWTLFCPVSMWTQIKQL